jgi:hypothetical protein
VGNRKGGSTTEDVKPNKQGDLGSTLPSSTMFRLPCQGIMAGLEFVIVSPCRIVLLPENHQLIKQILPVK